MGLSHHNLGTVGGFAAILLWSTTFAIARSLSEQLGPITAGAAAYLIGGAFCLGRLGMSRGALERSLNLPRNYLLGCGALFVIYTAAIYLAVGLAKDRLQLLEIALVNYLWPALTIVLSLPLLNRRASLLLLPGTILAVAGVVLVMTQGSDISWESLRAHVRANPAAYALALVAALSWALYSNLARRWADPRGSGGVEWFLLATGLVLLGLRGFVNEPGNWNARAAVEVLALAGITAVAYILWDVAMRKGNLLVVVVVSYFTPLLSTFVSCFYLKVTPAPGLWIGCLLLVCGSLLTWRSVANQAGEGGAAGPPDASSVL